jgi:ATP-binding cassette subfamily C protein CydD
MRVKTELRERLFAHLLALGPTYTKGERSGELTNTLVEGVEALDAYFSQYLPQIFLVVLMPLVIVIVVFSIDPLSGIVLLVTAPVLPIFMILIGMQAEALTKKQWKLMSLMSAHFLDVLQGITTLKLFGRSAAQEETIRNVSERFRHTTMRVLRVAFLSSLVMEMGATLSTAIIAVEIGLRLLYGQIAFQPALFVLLLAPEFYLPLRTLGTRYHAGMTGSAAAQRIFEILEIPLPSDALKIPLSPIPWETAGAPMGSRETAGVPMGSRETGIRFEDVSFAYDESRPVLKSVSLHIEPGQQVALVGASGAGKSTLAHLLLRFMEPESGTISINGIASTEISASEWREQIAWAPQRPYLFNATVAENIRLAAPNATHEEVVQAAQQADAHEFIIQLPQGYATIIGERGTSLSGGQVQRLSLARAFLKNAPVLIVDEATSNLAPEQEAQVLAAMQRLMQGRMVLIIAHHLSAIYNADQVIMLTDGQIVDADMKYPQNGRDPVHRVRDLSIRDLSVRRGI